MPATLSRVFMNVNSQAVRIPQEFRLATSRVEIFRNADRDLVLHPVPTVPEQQLRRLHREGIWPAHLVLSVLLQE